MSEIKRILSEMFQEENGGYSMLRIVTVLFFLTVISTWAFVSIHNKQISDIPGGLASTLGTLLAAKVWQKKFEPNQSQQ